MTVIKNSKTNMYEVRTYYKDLMGGEDKKQKEVLSVNVMRRNGKDNSK